LGRELQLMVKGFDPERESLQAPESSEGEPPD
jgi:hypothetical protein